MGIQFYDLRIYQKAKALAVEVDAISLTLPKHELYETGSQIRRSSKSIVANIAEGYGRRRYTCDMIRFYTYAIASSDETRAHLELLYETGRIDDDTFNRLVQSYTGLSVGIFNTIKVITK